MNTFRIDRGGHDLPLKLLPGASPAKRRQPIELRRTNRGRRSRRVDITIKLRSIYLAANEKFLRKRWQCYRIAMAVGCCRRAKRTMSSRGRERGGILNSQTSRRKKMCGSDLKKFLVTLDFHTQFLRGKNSVHICGKGNLENSLLQSCQAHNIQSEPHIV